MLCSYLRAVQWYELDVMAVIARVCTLNMSSVALHHSIYSTWDMGMPLFSLVYVLLIMYIVRKFESCSVGCISSIIFWFSNYCIFFSIFLIILNSVETQCFFLVWCYNSSFLSGSVNLIFLSLLAMWFLLLSVFFFSNPRTSIMNASM